MNPITVLAIRCLDRPGDPAAAEALAREARPYLASMARPYRGMIGTGGDADDLVQAGSIAMLEALGGFDPALGFEFTSYFAPRVRNAIARCAAAQGSPVTMPTPVARALRGGWLDRSGFREGVRDAARKAARPRPIELAAGLAAAERAEQDEELLLALGRLPERAARVLRLRFGLGGSEPVTGVALGRAIGLTSRRGADKALASAKAALRGLLAAAC